MYRTVHPACDAPACRWRMRASMRWIQQCIPIQWVFAPLPGATLTIQWERSRLSPNYAMQANELPISWKYSPFSIGLYRDVWIAAIASSRTRLATLTGAMCKTSQCELRSLRVKSGMLNVIRIVTYYTLPPLESPDSFWIAMAISR